jgi:hypothetical protein
MVKQLLVFMQQNILPNAKIFGEQTTDFLQSEMVGILTVEVMLY